MRPAANLHNGTDTSTQSSQRFVDAALELFAEHGYNGTSLQMIGDRLGVTKAAVTYHFPSKEDLLAAVTAPAFSDLARVLEQAESVRGERARRTSALHSYIDYLIRQRHVTAWLSRDVAALTLAVVLEPAQRLTGRIDAMLISSVDSPLAQIWGAAISHALTGPMLTEIEITDDELRVQLESIGKQLIRGYHTAQRQAANSC